MDTSVLHTHMMVRVRDVLRGEVRVPAEIDTCGAQAGGALVLLDGGRGPAAERSEIVKASVAIVVSVPAAL